MLFIQVNNIPAWIATLPSELKNESYSQEGEPLSFTLSLLQRASSAAGTTSLLPVSNSTGAVVAAAAAASTALPAGVQPEEAWLFDQEAATTWATPMLLQFLLALMLSWRTKLGGNLKISEDKPCAANVPRKHVDLFFPENRGLPAEGISGGDKSGSVRQLNDGNALAQWDAAIRVRVWELKVRKGIVKYPRWKRVQTSKTRVHFALCMTGEVWSHILCRIPSVPGSNLSGTETKKNRFC